MNQNTNQFEMLADATIERRSRSAALLAEIRRQVRRIKIEAGCQNVPTDIFRLARHLKVANIQEIPLPMRGRLLLDDGNLIIQINSDLLDFDKLQTIAHELSHLIVEKKSLQFSSQRADRAEAGIELPQKLVEDLCDEAAAEILLPRQWLRDRVKNVVPSLDLLFTLATDSKTSIEYVANQICRDGLWGKCKFIWWRKDNDRISAIKCIPDSLSMSLLWIEPENYQSSIIVRCFEEQKFLSGKETLLLREEKYINRIQCLPLSLTDIISLLY